jgi:hypothetical protein
LPLLTIIVLPSPAKWMALATAPPTVLTMTRTMVLAGSADGDDEGTDEGAADRNVDGAVDGDSDGTDVGTADRVANGSTNGTDDGTDDGAADWEVAEAAVRLFDKAVRGVADAADDGTVDGAVDGAVDGQLLACLQAMRNYMLYRS